MEIFFSSPRAFRLRDLFSFSTYFRLLTSVQYEGNFENGKLQGAGKFTSGDGSLVYEGNFKDNARHGKGVIRGPKVPHVSSLCLCHSFVSLSSTTPSVNVLRIIPGIVSFSPLVIL
jgi:hypothetical protein